MSTSKKCIENEVGQKKVFQIRPPTHVSSPFMLRFFLHMNSIFEPKILYFQQVFQKEQNTANDFQQHDFEILSLDQK